MIVFNSMKRLLVSFSPLILAGASNVPIPRRDESSSNSYYCQGLGDYNVLPGGKLNGTKCDCGGAGILQPLTETPRIVTNFSDTTQCTNYVLISARGTLEPDGISSAFIGLTYTTLGQVPNGAFYSVQYPAGLDQNTTLGVQDVVNSLTQGIEACPNRAYVLLGASQGASVIVKTLPLLSNEVFNHVKAVIMVASPYRTPGKKSNVNGRGARTKESNKAVGVFVDMPDAVELPDNWDKSGKVLDICLENDGICNSKQACAGLTIGHLSYAISQSVQVLSIGHVIGKLTGRS